MIDLSGAFVFLSVVAFGITIIACFCIYFGVHFKWREHEVSFTPVKKQEKATAVEEKLEKMEAKLDEQEIRLEETVDELKEVQNSKGRRA